MVRRVPAVLQENECKHRTNISSQDVANHKDYIIKFPHRTYELEELHFTLDASHVRLVNGYAET